ncbi:MAG TPA: hypothetical protein VF765_11545 [Polyangiaceae bacterium]
MTDLIRGKTLLFHFSDGPMAGKTFEHAFSRDGTVAFRMADRASAGSPPKSSLKYEFAPIRDEVCAVSYLSKGYTLTTILDFASKTLVAFSSNEQMVSLQHGTFEFAGARSNADAHARS